MIHALLQSYHHPLMRTSSFEDRFVGRVGWMDLLVGVGSPLGGNGWVATKMAEVFLFIKHPAKWAPKNQAYVMFS